YAKVLLYATGGLLWTGSTYSVPAEEAHSTQVTQGRRAEAVGLGRQAREELCANQNAMCAVSCQGGVIASQCNVDTLTWSCTCEDNYASIYKAWQLPIPFQFCRMERESCLDSCKSAEQTSVGRKEHIKNSTPIHKRREDPESIDLEPMDTFQLIRHDAKMQAQSHSWAKIKSKMDYKDVNAGRKHKSSKKQKADKKRKSSKKVLIVKVNKEKSLHERSLAEMESLKDGSQTPPAGVSRLELKMGVRGKAKGAEWTQQSDSSLTNQPGNWMNKSDVGAPSLEEGKERMNTMGALKPGNGHDPLCESRCRTVFACGTSSAPEYSGLDEFLSKMANTEKGLHRDGSKIVGGGEGGSGGSGVEDEGNARIKHTSSGSTVNRDACVLLAMGVVAVAMGFV
ncbi:hypothetical protein BGZ94_004364, partial [Podila epigama]